MNETEILTKMENHELRIARSEERLNNIEKLQGQIQDLTISVHDLSVSIKSMVEEQSDINARVTSIEREPAEKWKNLTRVILSCVVTAIVTFILVKVGLK